MEVRLSSYLVWIPLIFFYINIDELRFVARSQQTKTIFCNDPIFSFITPIFCSIIPIFISINVTFKTVSVHPVLRVGP